MIKEINLNLAARLYDNNSNEVFAKLEKNGAAKLEEISNFTDEFLRDIVQTIASKMLLEHLEGKYPSIDILIDIGHYEDCTYGIDNPINDILAMPIFYSEYKPLIHHIYNCVSDDVFDHIRPSLSMFLIEIIEDSISNSN